MRGGEGKLLFLFLVLHAFQHSRQARNESEDLKKMIKWKAKLKTLFEFLLLSEVDGTYRLVTCS